jgi:uncharacterized protein (TIGR03437 family)
LKQCAREENVPGSKTLQVVRKFDFVRKLLLGAAGTLAVTVLTPDLCRAQGSQAPTITLVANAEGGSTMIAPNTWVEIKGSSLAPAGDSRTWMGSDFVNKQLPTQLDGVSATVNGKSAYVYYISPTQVNILTPPDALSGPVQVVVTNGLLQSVAFTAPAQALSPSFFLFNGGPYVAATHANGSLLGSGILYPGSTTPAFPGETVVLYANGFGDTSGVVSGSPSQSGSLSPLPAITIGGLAAVVQFAGLVAPGEFQFNVVVPPSAPDGDNTLIATFNGFSTQSGVLITVSSALVQTSESGNMLNLQSSVRGITARIGLNTAWGGSIVEASVNGVNYVNSHDTGREVQPSIYDGSQPFGKEYIQCSGLTGIYGWNPNFAGDQYSHGSPVLAQSLTSDSIYIKTQPLEWCPDNKGGGPTTPVLSDMYFEQTITAVPGYALAFHAHYRLTHFGTDTHAGFASQEIPAIFVNPVAGNFVYYGGRSPWTNDTVTESALGSPPLGSTVYAPEYWSALVDANGMGLTMFVPQSYPEVNPAVAYVFTGLDNSTSYFHFHEPMQAISPGSVIEADVYLLPGNYIAARQTIYSLNQQLTFPDIMSPTVDLDTPAPNASLSRTVNVVGWAIDNVAVAKVEISVDNIVVGQAAYGLARPDVVAAYPWVTNPGYTFSLDTTKLTDGPHNVSVIATDTSNNVAVLLPVPVIVKQ